MSTEKNYTKYQVLTQTGMVEVEGDDIEVFIGGFLRVEGEGAVSLAIFAPTEWRYVQVDKT